MQVEAASKRLDPTSLTSSETTEESLLGDATDFWNSMPSFCHTHYLGTGGLNCSDQVMYSRGHKLCPASSP